jgi:SSS family transporter
MSALAGAVLTRLRPVDLAVVAVYLVGITLFGLRFRKRDKGGAADKSLKSYFLANNTIPWWAIALSIVSAETSTLTIISVPGLAFAGDFGFLQVALGYMFGRVVVALLFLPRYFAGEMLTAYQLIDRRFGALLHKVTAGLFLLTRAAAEGVRVFAVSIVVGIAIGTRDMLSIAIISALTLLYTFEGGMAAVIWTDVVQMAIYIGGTAIAIATLGTHVGGGWGQIAAVAGAAGKLHWLHFAMNLTQTYTFWAGVLGGTFLTMASHGTDQLMVQRLLAARNLRQSQTALLSSGVVIFVQFAMFLLIGAGLFVFYGQHPERMMSGMGADRLFPSFIVREMPVGIAGLLVAAILAAAMSNLSAALNSLASTTVVDFYVRARPRADDRERALVAKSSTVLWALVLFAIAVYSVRVGGKGHVVEIGLSIAGVAYGCLLGVFLLGTLTRFATQGGAVVGMVVGFVLNVWLWQGNFPVHVGAMIVPKIAWTWYVLIGAVATFAVGALASLVLRGKRRTAVAAAAVLLMVAGAARAQDFSEASRIINEGIAQHKLPGAVLVVGHNGHVVFHQAYGERKLAGEPGLDGLPSPAEPMTEDTIFDMASLTKVLATSTSVMQLVEQGKVELDKPVETYLPEFNSAHDEERAKVTVRLLMTHTSGEAEDVPLKDGWGLEAADKEEGLRRAETNPLKSAPGAEFRYSDINFILLGAIVERISGEPEDVYVQEHVFGPLGMKDTRYLPAHKLCGPRKTRGFAVAWAPKPRGRVLLTCTAGTWSTALFARIAPTAHDDDGTRANNIDYDYLLRGTVHDPTTHRMGGVAGHAGVFSTAHDASLFSQALLDRLAGRPSKFPLKRETLAMMVVPEQPSNVAQATIYTRDPDSTAPGIKAVKGTPLRGLGWDINTAFSRPRGAVFPTVAPSEPASAHPSFGHTGFTGTAIWIDPDSDTYVVLLANAVHPRVKANISGLRGDVATAVAEALGLEQQNQSDRLKSASARNTPALVKNGVDVLESTHFSALAKLQKPGMPLRVGLMTNQTGLDAQGKRTVDVLARDLPQAVPGAQLVRIFTPEHGLFGEQDSTHMVAEQDADTHTPVVSLYGAHQSDRRPQHEQLKDLDAVVVDLQDAGVRFYTYESMLGYFVEAVGNEAKMYGHPMALVVLDRPDLAGGVKVEGPPSDPGTESYTNYMAGEPVRGGMTLGELARFFSGTKSLGANVVVVPMQNWTRSEFFDDTGLPWIDPSPNLKSARASVLYPGALYEGTNLSVGRGTPEPFEWFGAGVPAKNAKTGEQKPAWFHAKDVVAALTARNIAGVRFEAGTMTVAEDSNHYPYHGQTIEAVHMIVTDRAALDPTEMGLEIMSALHRMYPEEFALGRGKGLICNQATMDALARGDDPRDIAASWQPALEKFDAARKPYLLY